MALQPFDFSSLDIRSGDGFCILNVKVTPKASRNEVQGVAEGALRLRIQAPPVDGAANDRTRDYLADLLGCPRKRVRIERGHTHRNKAFRIEGYSPAEIVAALEVSGSGP
jgi:uncharacterized protein (TIGR00251 family)